MMQRVQIAAALGAVNKMRDLGAEPRTMFKKRDAEAKLIDNTSDFKARGYIALY